MQTTIKLLLREAKKLHKAAKSDSLSCSLPILRRLISSNTLTNISLIELRDKQSMIQRKHILQMLAYEAGYSNWASYRQAIELNSASDIDHYSLSLQGAGYLNLWFSSQHEAEAYAKSQGGKAISVGQQAVVINTPAN